MFTLIGGNPFTCYTGTTTFTGLRVVGRYETIEALVVAVNQSYYETAGLMIALDSDGKPVTDWPEPTPADRTV